MEKHTQTLVAHYLRSHGYTATLAAFEQELGLRFNPNTALNSDESLDSIIADRVNFKEIERLAPIEGEVNSLDTVVHSDVIKRLNVQLPRWTLDFPSEKQVISLGTLSALVISCAYFPAVIEEKSHNLGLFVTNTKYLIVFDLDAHSVLLATESPLGNNQQIKVVAGINGTNNIVLCDMNGNLASLKLTIANSTTGDWSLSTLDSSSLLKLHRRLITDFKYSPFKDPESPDLLGYFASIGWDSKLTVGRVLNKGDIIFETIGDYKLFTTPTCLLITRDESSKLPIFIVGRLDSSLLTLFTITSHIPESQKLVELAKLSLNDAQFSSHSFHPTSIVEISNVSSSSKLEHKVITVATNHVPYMRLITVVVPSIEEIINNNSQLSSSIYENLQSLYNANKENTESFQSKAPVLRNYILSNFNSLSPQDKYSSAILLSRPNCSGVWIPGDDGKLRGFDLKTGNVIETLDSNDGRAKSSFLGNHGLNGNSETIVVCGAVDKKIVLWST